MEIISEQPVCNNLHAPAPSMLRPRPAAQAALGRLHATSAASRMAKEQADMAFRWAMAQASARLGKRPELASLILE